MPAAPNLLLYLKKSGQLGAKAQEAAELTNREMNELSAAGYQEHDAWEIVRERYLFAPPEEAEEEDSPFWKLTRELNALQDEVLRKLHGTDYERDD